MRVLLADDHAIVRSGVRHILQDAFPGVIVAEVGTCRELDEKMEEPDWSALVLDIAMEDRNTLDLVPGLRQKRPDCPIIVLSMYSDRQFVVRALRAGVLAYLTKDRAPEELLQAMRAVLKGQRYIGESVALQLAEHAALGATSAPPHESLSPREYEVFLLLAAARSVSQIGIQLGVSVKTVSTYRSRILEKMGMSSNAQLMRYALEQGLVR